MSEIHVLDKHTAELIAAGEVVERPASAVKELCENAIDANAKNIVVTIERGGIALLQIQDDGSGIEPEYVATAFLRHATSKVKTQEDLESINTLGFRGEALASIASVAKVELLTKTSNCEYATLYKISAGQEEGIEAAARPVGTTIKVKDLFYNTPARMKFLKKDTSEANFVNEIVMQLALSHPEISFKLIRDAKTIFHTPGDNNILSAAYEILGRDFSKGLTEVFYSEGKYSVKGFITKPSSCRQSRSMQFFFINGRFVKNRTMMAALEGAYKGILMQGKFPGCVLFLTMPTNLVDVNVHPAKTEVRFARDNEVFDIIYFAVKQGVLSENNSLISAENVDVKENSFTLNKSVNAENVPKISEFQKALNNYFDTLISTSSNDTSLASKSNLEYSVNDSAPVIELKVNSLESVVNTEVITAPNNKQDTIILTTQTEQLAEVHEQTALYNQAIKEDIVYIGEIFKTYIIIEYGKNMCLIDKHAAHERLLYEKLIKNRIAPESQMLLEPIAVTLGADEKNALLDNNDILVSSGIEVEDFGGASVLVRSVPSDIETVDIKGFIEELANKMSVNRKDSKTDKASWVFHSISCRAAVKAGDKSSSQELLSLAKSILSGEVPPFCPHGRPVIIKYSQKELEKQFGRQA